MACEERYRYLFRIKERYDHHYMREKSPVRFSWEPESDADQFEGVQRERSERRILFRLWEAATQMDYDDLIGRIFNPPRSHGPFSVLWNVLPLTTIPGAHAGRH